MAIEAPKKRRGRPPKNPVPVAEDTPAPDQEVQQLPSQISRVEVVIVGSRPLLMSSPREVFEAAKKSRSRKSSDEYIDEEEAEKRAYRIKDGDPKSPLVIPSRCIVACLVKSSKLYKTRTKGISFSDMIKGSIFIDPDMVPLLDKKDHSITTYTMNKALVVVQRNRIVRVRPEIPLGWRARFEIRWNPAIYGLRAEDIQRVAKDAGYIGLLDWRPRFGIFTVESFKELPALKA